LDGEYAQDGSYNTGGEGTDVGDLQKEGGDNSEDDDDLEKEGRGDS
jgi:hypothetical protein